MTKIRVLGLLLAVPLLFSACSDSATGPGDGLFGNSYMRADLGGEQSGKFNVSGGLFGAAESGLVYGFRGSSDDEHILWLQATDRMGGSDEVTGRALTLFMVNPKKGTFRIDGSCSEDSGSSVPTCVGMSFIDFDAGKSYWILSGTVQITTLAKGRAAGTFEVSGTRMEDVGAEGEIQLTNGKFDVQIFDAGRF